MPEWILVTLIVIGVTVSLAVGLYAGGDRTPPFRSYYTLNCKRRCNMYSFVKPKYKAISQATNRWVYGQLLYIDNEPCILSHPRFTNSDENEKLDKSIHLTAEEIHLVKKDTICVFTGYYDKLDREIYTNDIVSFTYQYKDQDNKAFGVIQLDVQGAKIDIVWTNGQYKDCVRLCDVDTDYLCIKDNIYSRPRIHVGQDVIIDARTEMGQLRDKGRVFEIISYDKYGLCWLVVKTGDILVEVHELFVRPCINNEDTDGS